MRHILALTTTALLSGLLGCTPSFHSNQPRSVELTGELIHHTEENLETKYHKEVYYLKEESTNKLYKLSEAKLAHNNGLHVKVTGVLNEQGLQVSQFEKLNTPELSMQKISNSAVKGMRKVAAIRVRWNGQETSCSANYIEQDTQIALDDIFGSISENTFRFDIDVVGTFDFVGEPIVSGMNHVYNQVIEKAKLAGVNLGDYQHIALYMPDNWWDTAWNGQGSSVFVAQKSCDPNITGHELAHALGVSHAFMGGHPYGDDSDWMSDYNNKSFHAQHLEYLGWLDSTLEVKTSGVYEIASVDLADGQAQLPQAIKIMRAIGDGGDTNNDKTYAYFSYRTKSDLHSHYKKLNVHTMHWPGSRSSTELVYTTDVGGSYSDAANNITVSVISKTSTTMTLDIQMPNAGGNDNQAPALKITSHNHHISVEQGSSLSVQALAYDNVAVNRVEFRAGNQDPNGPIICSDNSEPYECQWSPQGNVDSVTHLTAYAIDSSGNMSGLDLPNQIDNYIEATIVEAVAVDSPPTLTITSPADGATVFGSVWLQATATDDVGIASVKFYINDQLVKTDTSAPFNYYWDTTNE